MSKRTNIETVGEDHESELVLIRHGAEVVFRPEPTGTGCAETTICQSCGATVAIPDRMTATQAARVLARRAAAAPSPARQAASRANGRKGGRPRRRPTTGAEGAK